MNEVLEEAKLMGVEPFSSWIKKHSPQPLYSSQ